MTKAGLAFLRPNLPKIYSLSLQAESKFLQMAGQAYQTAHQT